MVITKYMGKNALRVRVPAEIEGQQVVGIGEYAFFAVAVMEVYLPDSIIDIGQRAFSSAEITSIVIPDSVTDIDQGAFVNCEGLTRVTIGSGVINIVGGNGDGGVFANTALYNAAPDGLFYVGNWLISYKGILTGTVEIKEGTKGIAGSALSMCDGITNITIPDSVENIGEHAFSQCTGLTGVIISNSVAVLKSATFLDCTNLISVQIPDSVIEIDHNVFMRCTSLDEATRLRILQIQPEA